MKAIPVIFLLMFSMFAKQALQRFILFLAPKWAVGFHEGSSTSSVFPGYIATSFPGSLSPRPPEREKRDPGWVWSRASWTN